MVNQANRARFRRPPKKYLSKAQRQQRDAPELSYWEATRSPFASLLLVSPVLIVYEIGCIVLGSEDQSSLRTGADFWLRNGLSRLGLTNPWILPLGLVSILVTWQILAGKRRPATASLLPVMIFESVILAISLVGVSRLVDLAGDYLESPTSRLLVASGSVDQQISAARAFVSFLGAGLYEEFLFRLLLVPSLFYGLRLVRTPYVIASAVAVATSGLLFSLAHHAGAPGEPFTWFAFVFRWFAGLVFAWIFVIRGFGIAVGTHTTYDVLVGWLGWHF